jgi:hypothetical protein
MLLVANRFGLDGYLLGIYVVEYAIHSDAEFPFS